jgi:glutamate/tyrosine decarboxylase-like PLP-dependent enzyme
MGWQPGEPDAAQVDDAARVDESLDPQDWEAVRALGHEMVDRMIDLQRNVRDEAPWRPMPEQVRSWFDEDLPLEGQGLDAAYRDFLDYVLPYRTGNVHPRFWGWVSGTGTPGGMLAELLAGGTNAIAGIFNDSASAVHDQVVRTFAGALGFGAEAGGLIVSGASVANLIGLAVARDTVLDGWVPAADPAPIEGRPMLYASEQVHSSVDKAAHLLGLGRDAVRKVAVDDRLRVDLGALEVTLNRDREAGLRPFCLVGTVGTVNTGAVDDLEGMSELARRFGLWLHVDGAFGAMAALSPELRPRVRGLELADSLAFDFHKWLYIPYEAGAILVRDPAAMKRSFGVDADYLETMERGVGARPGTTRDRGMQLSRGFKALKVWLSVKEHGLARYGRQIRQNVAQAEELERRVAEAPDLELSAPTDLNVVCFRYVGALGDPANQDEVNREILMRLHEDGIAVPSYTRIRGRFAIRVAITNHRTRSEDLALLVAEVVRLGDEISGQLAAARANGAPA